MPATSARTPASTSTATPAPPMRVETPDARVETTDARIETPDARIDVQPAPLALRVAPAALTVREGAIGRFTVRLDRAPTAAVTVDVGGDPAVALVVPRQLTFTPESWQVAQVVEVFPLHDSDTVDDATTVAVTHGSAGRVEIALTVTDVDTVGIALARSTLPLTEGGTATVAVRLTAQPVGAIAVDVVSADTGAVTASPDRLTFTATTWSLPQLVTIGGAADSDTADEGVAVAFSIGGAALASLAVTVQDDDTAGISAPASVAVDEGATVDIPVALTHAPAAPVVVRVVSSIGSLVSVAPSMLTFTAATWDRPQVVTASALVDGDVTPVTVPVLLMADGLTTRTVEVAVADTQGPRLVLSRDALTLAEAASGTVTVALRDRPPGAVVIAVASSDTSAAVVTPLRLAFTSANFDQPQTLTIVAVPDTDELADSARIELSVGGQVQAAIRVDVPDDVPRTVVASPSPVTVREDGSVDIDVQLSAPPAAPGVVVRVVAGDHTRLRVSRPALAFRPDNWNVPQRVTLMGIRDADTGDQVVTLALQADGFGAGAVPVTVDDIDTQEILTTAGRFRILEGTDVELVVALRRPPGGTAIVTAVTVDSNVAAVTPSQLTFTDATWATPQRVRLSGVRDGNTVDDSTELHFVLDGATTVVREVEVVDTRVP
jgi:hypothetical protein